MAEKILKTRKQFTTTLRKDLFESLNKIAEDTQVPKTKLLDQAVELLIESYNQGLYRTQQEIKNLNASK